MNTPAFKQELLGDASVGYSGGLDSTTVAYVAALQRKGRVHLHTLIHGYGYLCHKWTLRSVRSLTKVLGDGIIVHRFVNTKDIFTQIAMKSLLADHKKYGQWFGCCLGCTMALFTKMVIYNLEHGVPHILFGSSVGGQYAVMSMPVTIGLLKDFCGRYGMLYSPPLLENVIVKETERQFLDQAGIFRGYRFLDKHSFANQGYCVLSLQHVPDVLFNVHPINDPAQVERFFVDKRPMCEAYIRDHFAKTGQDLDQAIAKLRSITGAPDPAKEKA
jgi:hypothetical protein